MCGHSEVSTMKLDCSRRRRSWSHSVSFDCLLESNRERTASAGAAKSFDGSRKKRPENFARLFFDTSVDADGSEH